MSLGAFLRLQLIAFCLSMGLHAKEIPQKFQSVRALGMGGVYAFPENDAGVLHVNPAGLGKVSGINLNLFNVNVGINGLQIYSDLKDVGNISGLGSLNNFYGKNIWVGANGYSAFALPYFGFSVLGGGAASLRLDNPAYPNMGIDFVNDYGFSIGGAVPIGPAFYLGLALKRITRKGGHQDIGPILLSSVSNSTLQSQFSNEGVGYGIDTGILVAPPVPFNPIVSLAWQDAGSTAFTKTAGTAAPDRIKDNLTLGTTVSAHLPGLGFATGLEYRHITDSSEPLGKKIHMGFELTLLNMDARVGFYQGYTTYGFGMDLFLLQFDVAAYTVEKGAYSGQTPDQRIEFSLSMDLGFDPNLSFLDAGGRKRKLKQRR